MRLVVTCGPNTSVRTLRQAVPSGTAIVKRRRSGRRHFISTRGTNYSSRFPRRNVILNWGCSDIEGMTARLRGTNPGICAANPPFAVKQWIDKRETFLIAPNDSMPIHWLPDTMCNWYDWLDQFEDDAQFVLRHQVTGTRGQGIEVVNREQAIAAGAPKLATLYHPSRVEYRTHFYRDGDMDIRFLHSRKRRERGEEINYHVRNRAGGWVYTFNGPALSDARRNDIENALIRWLSAFPYITYGAIDHLWIIHSRTCLVLEGNTAPGLGHITTRAFYNDAFTSIADRLLGEN